MFWENGSKQSFHSVKVIAIDNLSGFAKASNYV